MCEPTTILAAGSLALSAGGAIAGYQGQKEMAAENKKNALAALMESWKGVNLRETQEQDAATQTIMGIDRQTRASEALARVSAGEAGVAGASVDAILNDMEFKRGEAVTTTRTNLDMTIAQLEAEKRGQLADAKSRIASVPQPSLLQTGLQIAGAGLDFGSALVNNRPKPKGS